MSKSFIAIVTALAAAATLTSTAEAGGGVRLNFGLPLGSFTATPARGGGAVQSSAYEHKPQRRKTAGSRAMAAKKVHKTVARTDKPSVSKPDVDAPAEVETVTREDTSARTPTATGSLALIETRSSSETPAAPNAEPALEANPGSPEAAMPVASTALEPAAEPAPETTPAAPQLPKDDQTVTASEEGLKCKKFIPAVGITVSVSCSN